MDRAPGVRAGGGAAVGGERVAVVAAV